MSEPSNLYSEMNRLRPGSGRRSPDGPAAFRRPGESRLAFRRRRRVLRKTAAIEAKRARGQARAQAKADAAAAKLRKRHDREAARAGRRRPGRRRRKPQEAPPVVEQIPGKAASPQSVGFLTAARVPAIRLGLAVSLSMIGMAAYRAWATGIIVTRPPTVDDFWPSLPYLAGALGLLVLAVLPWRRLLRSRAGTAIVFLWMVLLNGLLVATAGIHQVPALQVSAFMFVVVLAAMLLPFWGYVAAAAITLATYAGLVLLLLDAPSPEEFAPRILALGFLALFAGIFSLELRAQARGGAVRLNYLEQLSTEMRHREQDLMRLYEVARTIGAGQDMHKVLPELAGLTAGYLDAKVGVVLLHRPDERALHVLSPIWVAGQALEAEGYSLAVPGPGAAAWAFTNGRALASELGDSDDARDDLVDDLGIGRVAAVPLRVEAHTIGVLMVADKAERFTEEDLEALQMLAGPAALVLDNLVRYEQAQETGRRMAELARLKSDFVSMVSHELRTPLTSVIGSLSTLARPELAPVEPTARKLLDSALGQAQRLRRLIEDLLIISRLENRSLPQHPESIDIADLLTETVLDMGWSELVSMDLPGYVPPVHADREHLRRVVINLVENARKYGGPSPIEVVARSVGEEAWVSVIDHGPGVPYEHHEHIFERFSQLETTESRSKGGAGLGLSIVRELVESMGGRVWLEPTMGGGATFTVALPAPPVEHLEAS